MDGVSPLSGWDAPARVAVVATARDLDAAVTAVAGGLTVLLVLLTVVVLGAAVGGRTGLRLSRVEFLAQLCLLVTAGAVASRQGTAALRIACAALGPGVVALSAVLVPLYGEATVAP